MNMQPPEQFPPEIQPPEETVARFPRIKPIYLFGGGVAFTVLIACAGLSLCAAVALFWLNSQVSPAPPPPSPTVIAARASSTPFITRTLETSRAAPTGLPLLTPIGTPLVPVATPAGGSALQPSMTPDQAVRSYYLMVGAKRYDVTWPLLTDAFRQKFNCCAPDYNYAGYIDWWDSVERVEFGTVNTVSQTANTATVYAELNYVMKAGGVSVDAEPYFKLVLDPASGNWLLADKGPNP